MSTSTITRDGQSKFDTQGSDAAAGTTSTGGQSQRGTLLMPAAGGTSLPASQRVLDAQSSTAGGDSTRNGSATASAHPAPRAALLLADPFLALAADVLDDAERTHIANANRLRQLTRTETDSDGQDRGFGLDESHPDVARLAALVDLLAKVEHDATLNLNSQLRKHPLYPFIKPLRGVGDKQAARLLAAIGDPYWNDLHGRPRTVSELWAYCGLRPGLKRTRGVKSNWSTNAKTRAWLVVESCMKQLDAGCKTDTGIAKHVTGCACSPYRVVIDERRLHTAVTNPDWTPKHSQLDGMRVASKALLRDLWREAKRLHELPSGQTSPAAQEADAAGANLPADHTSVDTRTACVGGTTLPDGQVSLDAQCSSAAGGQP